MSSLKSERVCWRVIPSVVVLLLLTEGFWTPAGAKDRALLVGLERYADPQVNPTPGGREDARSMAHTLESRLGFASEDIRVLLDEAATSQAILDSFEQWLIEGSQPGDRVFFLYAGHGSQLADQNGDEADGFDETLAPFDVDPATGEHQIRDDVLDGLIAQLTGRRAVLLFDSCHSGTLTRGVGGSDRDLAGPGVRYLPRPGQWASLGELRRGTSGAGSYGVRALESGDQRAFDDPDRLGRMAGIVAISAAGPGQLAYPVEVAGTPRGALSYLFEEAVASTHRGLLGALKSEALNVTGSALSSLAGDAVQGRLKGDRTEQRLAGLSEGLTVSGIESAIESGMKKLQASGRLQGQQQPWFEVLSETPITEQPLFGGWEQAASAAMSNPIDPRRVTLRTRNDRTVYHYGEDIVFQVSTDTPGFLYLLVFSEGEKATCLFPNPSDSDNRVGAGAFEIPTHERYRLPVQEPFGRDLVVALVSEQPLPLCETIDTTWSDIFARVQLEEIHQRLRVQVRRGIGVAKSGASSAVPQASGPPLPSWQTDELVLHTVATAPGENGQ